MLPTFVIGLREGLEAALIVGIIAAFLRKQGRKDLLRWVFLGITVAVLLCAGVGIALKLISRDLPQKQQEGMETVIGIVAIVMVTYMVVWMRRHSRELKGSLESLAAGAIDGGGSRAGMAMVGMAFLAVLREGFETAVFLLAAFNESDNTAGAASGAVIGILVAVALGYGIYRGGVSINLSKFFRVTGFVLVLVAAGLVVNAFHTAHEAGWLNWGQTNTVDLSWLAKPGTVQASLLTGMLGVQPHPVMIEVVGWLAYLVPLGLYVAWPPGRGLPSRRLSQVLAASAGALGVAALSLALAAPSVQATTAVGAWRTTLLSADGTSAVVDTTTPSPAAHVGADGAMTERMTLKLTGETDRHGVHVRTYTGLTKGLAAEGQPANLPLERIAELNGGRLPLGIKATSGAVPATYQDDNVLTVWVQPQTGSIVDMNWTESVTATLKDPTVGTVQLSKPVAQGSVGLSSVETAASAAAARTALANVDDRDTMHDWAWTTAVLAVLALAAAVALLMAERRRLRSAPVAESLPAGDSALARS
ncbi:MAG TPA: iron uptake transporter permease EfeU [Jatrophihabitans sp.]|jgi:high-affinity iron transporter